MASAHITYTSGGTTVLCAHEEVKECVTVPVGSRLPRLTVEGSGAPAMCPECVAAHVSGSWRTFEQKKLALALLLNRVAKETEGTRQALATWERFAEAVRLEMHRLKADVQPAQVHAIH